MEINPMGLLNGAGVVGVVLLIFWALLTGRLCTGRELREKNQRIQALERTLEVRDRQLSMVMGESIPTVNAVLDALRQAAGDETT